MLWIDQEFTFVIPLGGFDGMYKQNIRVFPQYELIEFVDKKLQSKDSIQESRQLKASVITIRR